MTGTIKLPSLKAVAIPILILFFTIILSPSIDEFTKGKSLIAFATVTESVFAWPGLGKLVIDAIVNLDRPIVVAYLLFVVTLFLVLNLIVDIIYAALDPRVRLQGDVL